jgi:hypothetical protein
MLLVSIQIISLKHDLPFAVIIGLTMPREIYVELLKQLYIRMFIKIYANEILVVPKEITLAIEATLYKHVAKKIYENGTLAK